MMPTGMRIALPSAVVRHMNLPSFCHSFLGLLPHKIADCAEILAQPILALVQPDLRIDQVAPGVERADPIAP